MSRGGVRQGAGRKPGSKNVSVKSRIELMEKALSEGKSPLEVMLETMRRLYDEGELMQASKIAADAAPYCHSKLSAVEHSGPNGGPVQVSRIELVPLTPDE